MFPLVEYMQNTDYNLAQILISLVVFAVHCGFLVFKKLYLVIIAYLLCVA